jgi:hypothetical protein
MSTQEGEAFLSRWSRMKREERAKEAEPPPAVPATAVEESPAPPLPPVDALTPESDFTPFMHAKVPVETRRAALKKLFADPQFNIPDLNEAYSGDWTGGDPIPLEMLKTLNQAQRILFDEPPGEAQARQVDAAPEAQPGEAGMEQAPKEADGSGSEKQA